MFGHDNHDENNKPDDEQSHSDQSDQPADDIVQPSEPATDDNWQHPGPPPADDELDDSDDSDNSDSSDKDSEPQSHKSSSPPAGFSISKSNSTDDKHSPASNADNDLIDLKQEALTKLSPLVGHLDQSPDEKFRTLMMMIQASDDQRLVKQAYETALKIDDEKERAQALLDIVNEINYFTQNPGSSN